MKKITKALLQPFDIFKSDVFANKGEMLKSGFVTLFFVPFFQSVKWKKHKAISWLVGVISLLHEILFLNFFAAKM